MLPPLPSPLRSIPTSAADTLKTLSVTGSTLRSVFDLSSAFLAYLQRPAYTLPQRTPIYAQRF